MKKIIFIFLTLCAVVVSISTSFAVETTLFGPKQYLRTKGKPNAYTDTFAATCALPSTGMLTIFNGDEDGGNRINSALISVNGERIFQPRDFNQQFYCLEAPINLVEDNVLEVELRGKPGSYLILSITRELPDPPVVTISATPEIIHTGEHAILTWSSTNADACIIEPGIGSVGANGAVQASPTETTTYTITVTGPCETATADVTVTVIPITVEITSPSESATLSGPDVMVQGTMTNFSGAETGVVVNGIIAVVSSGQFLASHVPVEEGQNTITVTATDINGFIETKSITVNVETTGDFIRSFTDTESGTVPLEITLKVLGTFSFTSSLITYTGPGQVDFPENSIENEHTAKMTTPGVYYFTAHVTDSENNVYTDTVAIQALDEAELDALLRSKWEGMRQALAQNNIAAATGYFDDSKKDAYYNIFTALSSKLPQISQELDDIQFIKTMYNAAEYDIRTTRDGKEYSFYLLFVKDENGLWKIRSF
ncbi:MAG: hypothetical protein JXB42_01935 [Deltaproteobacteria bacterium]|nr:hypothetical protein [Deltaproteobacteria bacterium]